MYSRLSDTATNLSVVWSHAEGRPAGSHGARQPGPVTALHRGNDCSGYTDGAHEALQVTRSSGHCTLTARHEYNTLYIRVKGVLDIGAYAIFRASYETLPPARHYVLDLAATSHIDSAGLAMLLLLRDHAGGDRDRISLLNPRKAVRQVLDEVSFDSLFRIA